MNICQLFLDAAKAYPDKIAIAEKNKTITYQALEKEVLETVVYFQSQGLKKGDRVLVFVPMSIDLYRIVIALFYMGATAVFLDEWVSKKRMEVCCELADCQGFVGVFKARVFSVFSRELRKIPIKLSLSKKQKGNVNLVDVDPDFPALITFTTGSTGVPKAALRSHSFLGIQFQALIHEIQPHENDVDVCMLPIVLFINLGIGCTSVIADFKSSKPKSFDRAKLFAQLQKHQVNRMTASPFYMISMSHFLIHNHKKIQSIKKLFTGGAPVFPKDAALIEKAFTPAKLKIVYGSTEAEPISSLFAEQLQNHSVEEENGLFVGLPYEGTEVAILDLHNFANHQMSESYFSELKLQDDSIGQIVVSGAHVLDRYFKNDLAFEQNKINVNKVLWHKTGDSGFMKNGKLYLTGRCEQLIFKKDEVISPFVVEEWLRQVDGVTCGTVMEIENEVCLVLESKKSEAELSFLLKGKLFDRILIVNNIPLDPRHHSKIDYKALKDKL